MAITGRFGGGSARAGKLRLAAHDASATYSVIAGLNVNLTIESPTNAGSHIAFTPATVSGVLGSKQARLANMALGHPTGDGFSSGGSGPFTANVSAGLHLNVALTGRIAQRVANAAATLHLAVALPDAERGARESPSLNLGIAFGATQVRSAAALAPLSVNVGLTSVASLSEADNESNTFGVNFILTASAIIVQKAGSGTVTSNFTTFASAVKTTKARLGTLNSKITLAAAPIVNHAYLKSPSLTDWFGFTPAIRLAATATVARLLEVPSPLSTNFRLAADAVTHRTLDVSAEMDLGIDLDSEDFINTGGRSSGLNSHLAVTAAAYREVHGAATLNLAVTHSSSTPNFYHVAASLPLNVAASATKLKAYHPGQFELGFGLEAHATTILATGGGVPGGDQNHSLRTVLMDGLSQDFPNSYAETPPGLILIANGVDPMLRWDGLAAVAEPAGIAPPATGPNLGGVGVGTITGTYQAFVRFLDAQRNASNLSPVSNAVSMGSAGLIAAVTYTSAGVVTVRSDSHGLTTGSQIVVRNVQGLELLNGTRTITVVDSDTFTIQSLAITSGTYTKGGDWAYGVAQVVYSNVPVPSSPRVAIRQILRNTDGNFETYYVDIETADLSSTVLVSNSNDDTLAAGEPLPLFDSTDQPFANLYSVPPSHKSVVVSHQGRMWAGGEVTYTRGNVQLTYGSTIVQGVGTAWPASFAKRILYPVGAGAAYEISSVDVGAQTLTLVNPCLEPTQLFTQYAIRPAPGERRLVYYSEPGFPEAWPEWNAFGVPEDSDEIVSLMVKDAFMYVVERRHIRKFTFHTDPPDDGFLFLSVERGCINHRCWVQVEGHVYMLDEAGVHRFDGGQESVQLSTPIQNLFQQVGVGELSINWNADQSLWHAAHDPVAETIRWFVTLNGTRLPKHAICFNYRSSRWWIEEYPVAVTSSAVGTIGYRRSLAGSAARRVLCLGEGTTDACDPGAALRGTATGSSSTQLLDSTNPFPAALAGSPVSIVAGRGQGQQRLIADNGPGYLSVSTPWLVQPDTTSVYQVGGIDWSWRSGWFRFAEDEQCNPRDVELAFQPVRTPTTLNVQLYFDHALTPRNWNAGQSSDGLTTADGEPNITVNLQATRGFAQQRMGHHRETYAPGDRFVSIAMSGTQAGEMVRVFGVGLAGASGPEEQ